MAKAMYNWAKANMSKLKQPVAQKKIFEKYKAMKAAGDTPANPKPRPKPAATTPSKPASKPAQSRQNYTKPAQSKTTTKPATGSGVHGKPRPVGSPGPNKPYGTLDRSGARARRNLQDARRSRTAASAEVRAAGGSRRRSTAAIDREVKRNEGGGTMVRKHNVAKKNAVVVHGDVVCNATVVKCFPVNTTKTNGKTYLQSSRTTTAKKPVRNDGRGRAQRLKAAQVARDTGLKTV